MVGKIGCVLLRIFRLIRFQRLKECLGTYSQCLANGNELRDIQAAFATFIFRNERLGLV